MTFWILMPSTVLPEMMLPWINVPYDRSMEIPTPLASSPSPPR